MDTVALNKAAELLRRARRLAPERLEVRRNLSRVLPQLSAWEEAREEYLWLSQYHADQRDLIQARQCLEDWLAIRGEDPDIRLRLARLSQEAGDVAGAVAALAEIAEHYHQQGLLSKAQEVFEEALGMDPGRTDLRLRLIELHEEHGGREQVLAERFALAETLLTQGKTEEARAECRRLQLSVRGSRSSTERLAQLADQLGERSLAYSLYLELAHQEIRQCNHNAAMDKAKAARSANPDEEAPYELLTDLYLQNQDKKSATEELRDLANLLRRKKAIRKLTTILRRLLAIDESDLAAREELIECLQRQEDAEGVLRERIILARLYRQAERQEEALHLYHRALEKTPFNLTLICEAAELQLVMGQKNAAIQFYLEQSQTLDRLGARPEAEQLLLKLLEIDPHHLTALENLADLYRRMQRIEQAMERYEYLLQLEVEQGDMESAIRRLSILIDLTPGKPELHHRKAELLHRQGRMYEAAEAWMQAAACLEAQNQVQQAEQTLLEARKRLPQELDLLRMLIRFYRQQNRLADAAQQQCLLAEELIRVEDDEAAVRELMEALPDASDPVDLLNRLMDIHQRTGSPEAQGEALHRLAEIHIQQERWAEAEEVFHRLLALIPDDLNALQGLADACLHQENVGGACDALVALASYLQQSGRDASALETYRRVLELQPDHLDVRQRLISLLVETDALDEAVAELSSLARDYRADESFEKAFEAYQRAMDYQPGNTLLRREYADALLQGGQSEKALEQYLFLAETYQSLRLNEKALEVLKTVRAHWKDNVQVAQRLADLYQQEGLEHTAVQELFEISELLLGRSEVSGVRETLERLLEIDSKFLPARRRLAEVLNQLARVEEAALQYLRLAQLLADGGEIEEALAMLERAEALPAEYHEERATLTKDLEERGRRTAIQRRLQQARQLLQEQQWEKAQHQYEMLLEDYADSIEARVGLAHLLHHRKAENESRSLFLEAVDLCRQEGQTRQASVILQEMLEFWHEFEPALERLAQLEESSGHSEKAAELYFRIAGLKEKQGRLDLAIELDERVLRLNAANLQARSHLARLFGILGRHEEAFQQYEMVGAKAEELGKLAEATDALQSAVVLKPDEAPCHLRLAALFDKQDKPDEARQALTMAIQCLSRSGQESQAREHLDALLAKYPEDEEVLQLAIQLADDFEDHQEAVQRLKQLALIYQRQQRRAEAMQLYRKIIEAQPGDLQSRRLLATELEKEGHLEEAAEQYLLIGDLYHERGISGKAITFYRMAGVGLKDAARLHEKIADTYLKENLKEKAVTEYLALAEYLTQQERQDEAAQVYQRILDIDPGNLRVLNKLAQAHEAARNLDQAVRVYREIAETYLQRGLMGKAIDTCRRALEAVPHEISLRERLAELLLQKGALEEAKKEYQSLLTYSPGDLRITTQINLLDKKIAGGESKESVVKRRPDTIMPVGVQGNAFFDPYLSYLSTPAAEAITTHGKEGLSLFQRKRYSRAIEELTAAINLWRQNPSGAPDAHEYFSALGVCYLETRQYEPMIPLLTEALGAFPEVEKRFQMEIRYHLAVAHEALEQNAEALEQWKIIYGMDRSYRDVANKILWSRIAAKKKAGG